MAVVVDEALRNQIEKVQLSPRLAALRDRYFNEIPKVSGDRARVAVDVWKETKGDPIDLRRAKLLKRFFEYLPVVIHDNAEQTVGSQTRFFRGAYPDIEWDAEYFANLVDGGKVTFSGPEIRGVIAEEDWQACQEAMAVFKGETPAELVRQTRADVMGTWYDDLVDARGTHTYEGNPYFSCNPLYEKVIKNGLRSVIQETRAAIQQYIEDRQNDPEKLYFWQGVIMVCEGVITLARRYGDLARQLSLKEEDEAKRRNLEEAADICSRVPENPARTLCEAIQTIRLLDLALQMGCNTKVTNPGRMDQYLYPYFKNDLQAGRLTLQGAADLLGELLSYWARCERVRQRLWGERGQNSTLHHITLSGIGADGQDVSNDLTYLILHVFGLLKYAEPHCSIRFHSGTPHWLLMKGLRTNCIVAGIPMYINDRHVIDNLLKWGVAPEAAREWSVLGCSQPVTDPQRSYFHTSDLNVALFLDLALHDGKSPVTGKQLGPRTGDPRKFKTFDELLETFKKQHEFTVRKVLWATGLSFRTTMQRWRSPLHSALLPNCIKNGRDFGMGGCGAYPVWYIKDRALVDAADSLMAVKKLVFDEKKLTMAELLQAIDANFAGDRGAEIRHMCLAAPKYGNDIDEADCLLRDIAKFSAGVIRSEKNAFGYPYTVQRHGVAWHYSGGKGVGALPNGRKTKEPLDDGSLSPMRGTDKRGPTAVLNSAIKADFVEAAVPILNLKFPLSLARSPEALEKIALLTETFIGRGGIHVQYNFLDKKVLLEAQKFPEQYKTLVVRVGGYSAYFVNLTREVQDDIIQRTEQWC